MTPSQLSAVAGISDRPSGKPFTHEAASDSHESPIAASSADTSRRSNEAANGHNPGEAPRGSTPPDFNPALMAALTVIDDHVPAEAPYNQQLIAAKCRGMILGYDARWANVPFEVISIQQVVKSDLINIDTRHPSRTFSLAGKKDLTVRYQGQTVLVDHKTTSDDIADPDSPYWRQMSVESQPSHYMLIDWQNGQKIDYAIWDVVRKPAIAPKDISKAEHERAATTGVYCGYTLSEETVAELRAGSKRENLEMYTARLADDLIAQRPARFFQRRAVPRLDHQLAEHAREVWMLAQDLITARRENRWPRNAQACMAWGRPCKFLGICSGHDTEDSERWARKSCVHAELPIDGDGRDLLTFSRLKSLQSCRRKHYYEYELGIERIDEEDAEALYFGNLWDAALGAWFSKQPVYQGELFIHGNSTDFAPASAVGAIGADTGDEACDAR